MDDIIQQLSDALAEKEFARIIYTILPKLLREEDEKKVTVSEMTTQRAAEILETLKNELFSWDSKSDQDYQEALGIAISCLSRIASEECAQVVKCYECRFQNTCDHTIRIVPRNRNGGSVHGNLHSCHYGERKDDPYV